MLQEFFQKSFLINFAFSIFRIATPLIYCALGALVANVGGAMNMALEGIMLTASLTAVLLSGVTGTVTGGLVGALIGGLAIAAILAYMNLVKNADLTLTGISLNTFASGLTVYILYMITGEKGSSRLINSLSFPKWNVPIIKDIPIIGEIFSGHNLLTYLTIPIAILTYIFVYKSRVGLRIRAVGQNPNAASSVGINVTKTKFIAFMVSGLLASFGGAFMSMGYLSLFSRDMVSGRGYIGMSAANLADGSTLGTVLASFGFAIADAAATAFATFNMKAEIVGMIPYLATILGLVIVSANKQAKIKKKEQGK